MKDPIIITAEINASLEKVWEAWSNPQDIIKWNSPSIDWHCPKVEIDLKVGGLLKTTIAAKDGSFSFDFVATYTKVKPMSQIDYKFEDGRKASTIFKQEGNKVIITESLEAESLSDRDVQYRGWKVIIKNFKKHTEAK